MKTKSMILAVALIVGGAVGGSIQAQKHLDALVKKCESMDKVNVEVILSKDKKTRQLERSIKTISFSSKDNPQLLKDFIEAFKADQDEAYKVSDRSVKGKIYPSFYRFDDGKTNVLYTAGFTANNFYGSNDVVITRIERSSSNNDTSFNLNGKDFDVEDMRGMAEHIASNVKIDSSRWANFNTQWADSVARISSEKALNKLRAR